MSPAARREYVVRMQAIYRGIRGPGARGEKGRVLKQVSETLRRGHRTAKRLMRSRDDRVVAGVCGGLGEYLGVDSVLIRIAALILVFAGGAGILLYLIGWIAMPEAPEKPAGAPPTTPVERRSGAFVLGLVFVFLGILFLVDEIWSDVLAWKYVWPIALIVVGAAILLRPRR